MRSRKSPEKLRLPQPTERDRATFRPKDDDDEDTWLGLSGSPMASILRAAEERSCWSCCAPAPALDAHAAEATDTDFLLAPAPLVVVYDDTEEEDEAVCWCAYADEEEER